MLRIAFWVSLGIAVLFTSTAALLSTYGIVHSDTSNAMVTVGLVAEAPMLVLMVILDRKTKRERAARFARAYPTREAVLQAVDSAAIRDTRDTKGGAYAIRMLRKQVPDIPLAKAAELVRNL